MFLVSILSLQAGRRDESSCVEVLTFDIRAWNLGRIWELRATGDLDLACKVGPYQLYRVITPFIGVKYPQLPI